MTAVDNELNALKALAAEVAAGGDDISICDYVDLLDVVAPELMTDEVISNGESAASMLSDAYHGSLDAAKALHEAVLPGWWKTIWGGPDEMGVEVTKVDSRSRKKHFAKGPCPARAWLLAIIKAKIAELE